MIIGLAGKKRCGKSTVSQFLCDRLNFKEDSFGAPIREFIANLCGYNLTQLDELKEVIHPLFGVTPRYMMQTLGTEWARRMVKDSIWIDLLVDRFEKSPHEKIVVSDIRFENEADTIRSLDGHIIHIVREDSGVPEDSHSSESGILVGPEDTVLFNNSDINTMLDGVKVILDVTAQS